ncbi:hypothetical protein AQUCO_00900685v1 [Aquilegia coerulea]|uniref:FAF domain-containing protein n=1 Tax=Aquilegia coerulea TaxID=218851 RepID=A0A2G5EEY7_AQUCA|nr:hypothetical protein AQUCO_00900685v1 [Aquilegia coerulea]
MSTAVMSMSVTNELQGIGSVLGSSDYQRSKTAASLRRTLSADMSSKKWLAKNGFCPLKKIASSEDLQFDDKTNKEEEPPGQSDIWSSIITQKSSSIAADATPYVHPLAKRARSLSQQSLEICTESLGSETGSDGFSSAPPSETSDDEDEEVEQVVEVKEIPVVNKQESSGVVIHNSYAIRKSLSRSFPPPLPSLSQSGLHMRSHRVDGRLVVEAIPTHPPTQNYFQAQREGGRLLLTLANPKSNDLTNTENTKEVTEEASKLKTKSSQKDEVDEEVMFQEEEDEDNNEFEEEEDEEEEEGDEEEIEQVMDRGIVLEMKVSQPTKILPTGVINVHRSALMVNKLMGLTNREPSWSPKLEKMVDIGGDQTPLVQSLPQSQLVSRLIPSSAASSFNTYDYCWRPKPPGAAAPTVCTHPLTQNPPPITKNNKYLVPKNMNPQDLVLMRGNKTDYLVPVFKGCKEPRRSLLVWEPYCIATS